jgi:hypothetical protein
LSLFRVCLFSLSEWLPGSRRSTLRMPTTILSIHLA